MGAPQRAVRPAVPFASESTHPVVRHLATLAGGFCGVELENAGSAPPSTDDIYYGNDVERPCGLRIPRVSRYTVDTVPPLPGELERRGATALREPFPFDLFEAVRFWVTDAGNAEQPDDAFDEHDRLRAARSAQSRRGVREIPIVNAYLLLLREWVERRLGVSAAGALPRGRRCVVALSHDVDSPIDPHDPWHELWLAARGARHASLGQAASHVRASLDRVRGGLGRVLRRRPRDRHWLFPDIVRAEAHHGFRSTFFFAATSRFCPGGHPLDVEYDVRAPRFRRLCRGLAEGGWEVGLHISYSARASAGAMAAERRTIEEVLGRPVLGSRHHYWHMARPFWSTLDAHSRAGLRFDSSAAFEEEPGYRLGIAYPFTPWDPLRDRPIGAVQLPTALMDGALLCDGSRAVDDVLARVESLLANLKRYEGVAAIDWHEYTSAPASARFRRWGEAYFGVLELLAADPEIEVTTCADAVTRFGPPATLAGLATSRGRDA